MNFFQKTSNPDDLNDRHIMLGAFMATLLGIAAGLALFPNEASIVGVFLVAFSEAITVEALLERNRREVWDPDGSPGEANRRMATSLFMLFLGIFFAYVIAVQLAPFEELDNWFDRQLGNFMGGSMADVHFADFAGILRRNALVLLVSFLFALFYRHGGMLLVLAWNASKWGVIFSYVARMAARDEDVFLPIYLGRTFVCIIPHLFAEALAYILVAMSGVFLSKGLAKYSLSSKEFTQVGGAVLRIAGMSMIILVVAGALEAYLAPVLVTALFRY